MKHYGCYGKRATSFRTLAEWLKNLEEFKTSNGNFSGLLVKNLPGGLGRFGKLPNDWQRTLETRINVGVVLYVVRSYTTPIAWYDQDMEGIYNPECTNGWVRPGIGYSHTTKAKHLGPIDTAISVLGDM